MAQFFLLLATNPIPFACHSLSREIVGRRRGHRYAEKRVRKPFDKAKEGSGNGGGNDVTKPMF